MKRIFFLLLGILFVTSMYSQNISKSLKGTWEGTLGGKSLRLVITNVIVGNNKLASKISGYTTVNNGNKTFFDGYELSITDENQQTTEIRLLEPKTANLRSNGIFDLEFNESDFYTLSGSSTVFNPNEQVQMWGKWVSYDGKLNRNITLKKVR